MADEVEFSLVTADLGDAVFRVGVVGEIDLSTAPELREALAEVIDSGARGVLVDLTGTTFVDSTALGVLLGALRRLRTGGGELAIACGDPNIRRLFEITLLDRVFPLLDSVDEGLGRLRRGGAAASFGSVDRVEPPDEGDPAA